MLLNKDSIARLLKEPKAQEFKELDGIRSLGPLPKSGCGGCVPDKVKEQLYKALMGNATLKNYVKALFGTSVLYLYFSVNGGNRKELYSIK